MNREATTAARATLRVDEAARMLGISRSVAYQAAHTGEIPVIRIGKRMLVPRHRLEQMLGLQNGDGLAAANSEAAGMTAQAGAIVHDAGV